MPCPEGLEGIAQAPVSGQQVGRPRGSLSTQRLDASVAYFHPHFYAGGFAAGFRGAKKLAAFPSPVLSLAGLLFSGPSADPAAALAASAPALDSAGAAPFRSAKVGSASELTSMSGSGRREKMILWRMRATISMRFGGEATCEVCKVLGSGDGERVRARLVGRSPSRTAEWDALFVVAASESGADSGWVRRRAYGVASFSILPSRR